VSVPPRPPPAPGLFAGPATRERNLFVVACLGSLIFMPLVGIASLFWWPAAAGFPGETAYRRRWILASVLLGVFDVLLITTLTVRSAVDDSFPLPWTAAAAGGGQPILGVACGESDGWVFIESVFPDTGAADAGLEEGDTISAIGGKPVRSTAELQRIVALHGAGELEIAYYRGGETRSATVGLREPKYLSAQRAGFRALRRGDLRRARYEFDGALSLCRSSPAAAAPLQGLASVSLREGDLDSAGSLLEEALKFAPPSTRDSLRRNRLGVAFKKGEPSEADQWLREIDDPEIRRSQSFGVLALEGRAAEAWRRWFSYLVSGLLSSLLFWLLSGTLAIMAVLGGIRRSPREWIRFFLLSAGALMGGELFGVFAAAAHGAWAHGNPFAYSHPEIFPVDAILMHVGPVATLALTILASRAVRLPGGLPLGLGWRGWIGLAAGVTAGVCLLLGFSWRVKFALWSAGFVDAEVHPVMEMAGQDVRMLWWLFPVVCLLAPAAEEFFFRGLLQGHLRARFGPAPAIAGTAVLFGLLHPVSVSYAAIATAMGIVFGYLRERSGALTAPILTHALWNTAAWTVIYFR
jgi:membrane protease YdiL (CAAX protease family)